MLFFTEWRAQRQAQATRDTLNAWWWSLKDGRPPCWVVVSESQHQPVIDRLVNRFWDVVDGATDVDAAGLALAGWDREVARTVAHDGLPAALQRTLQSWRLATCPGDAPRIAAAMRTAWQERRTIREDALITSLDRPPRQTPEPALLERWRTGVQRFGYTLMSSDASLDSSTWTVLHQAWHAAHAQMAVRLNEPDASIGAQRWSSVVVERVEQGGLYDPASRHIGVAIPPAQGRHPGAQAQALKDLDGLTQRWVENLAHERGHALDFWLGERSTATVDSRLADAHGFAMRATVSSEERIDPRVLMTPVAPLSVRRDPGNAWMDALMHSIPFTNACLGMHEAAPYLFRRSEMSARFWEGLVRTFASPATRHDQTFPALFLSAAEQQTVRNTMLHAAGLPLQREPVVVPSLDDLGKRLHPRENSGAPTDPRAPGPARRGPVR